MKRYEGLFILNTAGKEDRIQDIVDRLSQGISEDGGKVETVQKMEKKSFARVADKKHSSGFYLNIIFQGEAELLNSLQTKYDLDDEVFRVLFTLSPENATRATAAA